LGRLSRKEEVLRNLIKKLRRQINTKVKEIQGLIMLANTGPEGKQA